MVRKGNDFVHQNACSLLSVKQVINLEVRTAGRSEQLQRDIAAQAANPQYAATNYIRPLPSGLPDGNTIDGAPFPTSPPHDASFNDATPQRLSESTKRGSVASFDNGHKLPVAPPVRSGDAVLQHGLHDLHRCASGGAVHHACTQA
jgi:hypothetical protein